MRLISHRGNIDKKNTPRENSPAYIKTALESGFDVEVDIRYIDGNYYLGHDKPKYKTNKEFLDNLWCHAKDHVTLIQALNDNLHCFANNDDPYVLTSLGYIWCWKYSEINLPDTIYCIFDMSKKNIDKNCSGICSDYIKYYKDILK